MTQLLMIAFDDGEGIMPSDPVGWQIQAPGEVIYVDGVDLITCRAWQIAPTSNVLAVPSGAATAQAPAHVMLTTGISVDWDAFAAEGVTTVTLAQHGDDTNCTWRLVADVVSLAAMTVQLSLSWRNAAASAWRTVGGPIVDLSRPAVVAVCRERAADGFSLRWAVNGEPAGATDGEPLDIIVTSSGTGEVAIGQRAGYLDETAVGWRIEWIQVLDEATAIEELAVVTARFARVAPRSVATLRRYQPEAVYSSDPASLVDREIRAEGVLLSWPRGAAERLLTAMPAGASFGEMLTRWEDVCRPGTGVGADVAARQLALAEHLRLSGSAFDEVKRALVTPLGLEVDDIAIDELDTTEYLEEFDTTTVDGGGYLTGGFDAARWVQVGAARFTFQLIGGSSLYRIGRTLSSDDMRYRGRNGYAVDDTSTPFLLHPTGESGRGTWWLIHVAAVTLPATGIIAGLVLGDVEDDTWTWIGVYNDGADRIGWVNYQGHLMGGSISNIATGGAPRFIRVRDLGGGSYAVQHSATNPADWNAIAATTITGAAPRARWAGIGVAGTNTNASGAFGLDVGRYWDRAPRGPGRLSWQAYRDPGLPGGYDLGAADQVIQAVSPSHVEGTPITHRRGIYTDDDETLLDRDPLRT